MPDKRKAPARDISKYIRLRGAGEHNLKNIDLDIPRNQLVVMTGLSGSGKSSLAFDTIYAEGQRRYMESLSSYARQFLGQMEKPKVDSLEGLPPAISIDQKSTNRNPRSTVGTVTEVYDYFRLLYARCGIVHCPTCGREIKKQTIDQMVDTLMGLPERTRLQLLAPVVRGRKGMHEKLLAQARKSGYVRVRIDGSLYELSEEITLDKNIKHNIEILVDRLIVKPGIEKRLSESLEQVLSQADGLAYVEVQRPKDAKDIHPDFRLSYTVKDPEASKNQLLGKAVADARAKAEVLTKAAGVSLKDIKNIDYSWGEIQFECAPMNRNMFCNKVMADGAGAFDMDIEPDDISVSDTVTVVWEIG